ncbi:hypothetical protein AXX17_AT3G23600 [Arabidopsis thaliana]|uniref:Gnk2-homologous domain-containing protein n=1 Tax=Arabidopsis thaliana TaxID=3702 RepID=A0A178VE48_ARATH|nr:hypothetical protein AXX17_AT3G23600 [Arabidopsis thaliana]
MHPIHYLLKLRSASILILFISSQSLCALSEPIVHELQLTKQLQINNFMGIIQETRSLRKNGIMIPSPRSASICYVLSKLNALSTTTLACNLKHQITITLARFYVKALLRVDFLVPARSQTLIPSLTPLCLLTAAICSSIDSFLEELSMTFDLTCTKKLVSFRLKALKDLLCFYLIYPSFYLMLALGNAFISCIVNIRISDSVSVLGEGIVKGSSYEGSVKSVIDHMSTYLDYGFVNGAGSDGPTNIYAKLQCRADASESKCRSCLATAFSEDVSSDTMAFNKNTRALLYALKEKAISKKELPYRRDYLYSAGEESLGKKKVYAMVQCTKDLSAKNCSVCLSYILSKLPKCCKGKQGGRVLSPSCNFRYELYPFVKT